MLRPGSRALTTLLAMLTVLGPISMDMYLPSLPAIAHVLDAPTAQVQLTIAGYLIGFAVGQVIWGPISDRRGRRPVLIVALALYAAGTLICAAAQSIDTLIAATAISRGLTLVTRNTRDFERTGVLLFDPWRTR